MNKNLIAAWAARMAARKKAAPMPAAEPELDFSTLPELDSELEPVMEETEAPNEQPQISSLEKSILSKIRG